MYGVPVISGLAGHRWHEPMRYPLPAGFDMPKRKTGRREFLRGWIEPDDGSGLISSAVAATGLIELVENMESVAEGDPVNFIPFGEFGIAPK